jgi:hypothetical protein
MISHDLNSIADTLAAHDDAGEVLSRCAIRALEATIRSLARQADQMEARPIPGAAREPLALRVVCGGRM